MPLSEASNHYVDLVASKLPRVASALTQVRARWRYAAILAFVSWSILLGLASYVLLEAAAVFLGAVTPVGSAPLAMAVTALALASATVRLITGAPDSPTLARAIERKFGLQERLSTAIEVAGSSRSRLAEDPVGAALVADAEHRAAGVDARRVIALRLPQSAWAVGPLLAIVTLLQFVPSDAFWLNTSRGSSALSGAAMPGFDAAQRDETAATLRRIADALGEDAGVDPYLRAVARTLERLSTDIDRGDADRAAAATELDRLLKHVRDVYSSVGRNAARLDAPAMLQAALDNMTGSQRTPVPD
ncbi:MAG: hypothetical protein ABL996_25180, partial [Micropepsaceae bacterium]